MADVKASRDAKALAEAKRQLEQDAEEELEQLEEDEARREEHEEDELDLALGRDE